MSDFPKLKTGATMQYPATKSLAYSTTVMRFLDGTEQRFRGLPAAARTWVVRLELLDEAEMRAVEEFFHARSGSLDDFSFTDPWDGVEYASCRIQNSDLTSEFLGEGRGRASLFIQENR
jgi:hypothetical protein